MKKILGIGNALVDVIIMLPDEQILSQYSLSKGSMQLVNDKMASDIERATSGLKRTLASGGSAANTIHGVAKLGAGAGYFGKIHNDEYGNFFLNDLHNAQIIPFLNYGDQPTGRAVTLVSPDSERTFATYLGSAVELNSLDLKIEVFKEYDILHIEGYLVFNIDFMDSVLSIAKRNNMIVSIDLASYNVVESNLEYLRRIINDSIDIVFANEDEAKAFTGKEPLKAVDEISGMCDIAIVKTGSKGSLIKSKSKFFEIGVIQAKSIDTTGAGDLYAGGFLFGLSKNLSLDKCGKIGALLAGNVIEVPGAKIPEDRWEKIRSFVLKMG